MIISLQFKTNKRESVQFGMDAGEKFSLGEKGHKIVGFHGQASDVLHSVGVTVVPITTTKWNIYGMNKTEWTFNQIVLCSLDAATFVVLTLNNTSYRFFSIPQDEWGETVYKYEPVVHYEALYINDFLIKLRLYIYSLYFREKNKFYGGLYIFCNAFERKINKRI